MVSTTELPAGISRLTLHSGQTRFLARVHRAGHGELNQRFVSLAEAIRWRSQVSALLDAGVDPSPLLRKHQRKAPVAKNPDTGQATPPDGQALTVRQAVTHYIEHRARTHKPIASNYLYDYHQVRDDFGDFLVSELRNEDLANYTALMLKTPLKRELRRKVPLEQARTYQPASIRKFLYALKLSLEWNAKNKRLRFDEHLFNFDAGVMPGAWDNKRTRRLGPGEEERLYAAGLKRERVTHSRIEWRTLIGFALETAMREQEIALARWEHVVSDGLRLYIPAAHTKTRKARTVLLSRRARAILRLQRMRCPKGESRIFFQFPSARAICDSFARLTERAGLQDLRFHDLRHEATSRLCESGKLSQILIMEMTGHASMATFGGYVHLIRDGTAARLD